MHHRRAPLAVILFGFALAACATGSPLQRAPEQVDTMVTTIEQVRAEVDRSKASLADSFQHLQALAAGKSGKEAMVSAYTSFLQAIDATEQQTLQFAAAVTPMQEAAHPVFEQWQAGVATIGSDQLRQLSEVRLTEARERYEAIVAAAGVARLQLDAYVKSLRDHAIFLAHDLNPRALDAMQDEVKVFAQTVEELDHSLDTCLGAARAYVEHVTLPERAAPAAPAR